MGVFDRLTGDSEPYDYYRVARSQSGKTRGGWVTVEGWDELEEVPSKDEFELNVGDLEPGRYRAFGVIDGSIRSLPSEKEWIIEIEGDPEKSDEPEPDPQEKKIERRLSQLDRKVDQALEGGRSGRMDPNEVLDELRANLLVSAVSNERFMARYGEKMMDWALEMDSTESGGDDGPGYDEWKDNPFAAISHDVFKTMMDEPHKMRELGENVGGGAGAFLDGLADGAQDSDVIGTAEEAEETEQESRLDRIDTGPASLDDLGASQGEESAAAGDEIVENVRQLREAREATDEPVTATDDDDGQMTLDEQEAQETPEEATLSEVRASPEVAEKIEGDGDGLDPDRCQFVTADGTQCGNPPQEESEYCWVEGHGPDESAEAVESDDGTDEEPAAEPPADDEPSEEEVANAL